jgi:hypothetical protein
MEWPKEGEILFKADFDDCEFNACVGDMEPSLSNFASSFKEGAEVLVQAVFEKRAVLDSVILPIVYLYRHYVELSLKDIIALGRRLESKNGEPTKDLTHDLGRLWADAKSLLREHYGAEVPRDIDHLDSFFVQFGDDPAFRYPRDRDKQLLRKGIRHINLHNLHSVMTRIGSFLDGISGDLDQRLQNS